MLRKASEGSWARLTTSNETIKNHRIWWEKQEQVERADREEKDKTQQAAARKEREEKEAKEAAEREEREAREAEEREKARQQRVEMRRQQKPLLDAALTAVDALAIAEGTDALKSARDKVVGAAILLLGHESVGQALNETAHQTAEQSASAIVKLRSTGFPDLTKDALTSAVDDLKKFLTSFVVPEEPATKTKKKAKKKKSKAAAAS